LKSSKGTTGMHKKLILPFVLALSLALAACSGSQSNRVTIATLDTSSSGTVQGTATPSVPGAGPLTSGDQLAIGTLKLEGTNLAVTATEAKQLLPLWQQVKSLTADTTASSDQIQAVYAQISSAMTADQVQAIQAMTFSQADLQALMATIGIAVTPGAGQNPGPLGTPNAQQGTLPSGGPRGQGTPRSGGPGLQGTPPAFEGTPGAGMPGGQYGGMNNLFVDALIKLLQQRGG
jgi:hypothetical protein